jgi:hypothetical protein
MQGVKEALGVMSSGVLVKPSATMPIHLARRVPLAHLLRVPFTFSIRRFLANPLYLALLLKMRLLFILPTGTLASFFKKPP